MPRAPGVALTRPIEASDLMLATVRKRPFSDPDWLYEWKYDGFRCLVRKTSNRVELLSRNGNSLNTAFPDAVQAVGIVPGDFVWDGELTVDDPRGVPSFERLQRSSSRCRCMASREWSPSGSPRPIKRAGHAIG
jgi:bifunctional non-homologous end joining protein LigD